MASNTPRPTKAERREAARAKAQALRQEQEKRERRARITRRVLIGAGAVVVVGGAAGLVTAGLLRKKDEDPAAPVETISTDINGTIAEGKADKQGVPGPVLSDGSWTCGKDSATDAVNEGAATVDIFFDYACPHCAEFDTLHADEISTLLNDGKATLILHPCLIIPNQTWTSKAMNAMGLVLDEDPGKALAFHNAIFDEFASMVRAQDASRQTVDTLVSAAEKAGVSSDVSGRFKETSDGKKYDTWTDLGTKAFNDQGLKGTPTVMVRGQTVELSKLSAADSLTRLIGG